MPEETDSPKGLAAKIAAIQLEAEVGKLPQRHVEVKKDGQIQYTYDYIEESTLMAHIRPLLAQHGVACFYDDEILSLNGNVATVRTSLTLVDGDTGEERRMSTEGMSADRGDKMVNKAKTAAMRYLLWKWFLVPSSMDDPEVTTTETSSKAPPSHIKLASDEAVEAFLADLAAAGFDREAWESNTLTPHKLEWEGVREDWLANQRRDLQAAIAKKNAEGASA